MQQDDLNPFIWEFSKFVFTAGEIRFACNNHRFQFSLLFHLTKILSTEFFFLKIELLLVSYLYLHNAALNLQVESILQQNLTSAVMQNFIAFGLLSI